MKRHASKLLGVLLLVGPMATCTDHTPTAVPGEEGIEAVTATPGSALACDLLSGNRSIPNDVQSFFQKPERDVASSLARDLRTACTSDNATLTTSTALTLLGMMETAINAGRAGAADVGARLARNLLTCTTSFGCSSLAYAQVPDEAPLVKAVGEPTGLFAIRAGTSNASVVARAAIPFIDDRGDNNYALFGTQVATTWGSANLSPFVFFYGYRTDPIFVGEEVVANNVGYSFNRLPDNGTFAQDDLVQVGACFDPILEVGFPHAPGEPDPKGRMQREGTLLSEFTALNFCTPAPRSASILAPVKAFALNVLPRSWAALFMGDIRTPVIGGSAYDFSNFAPTGANTTGKLVIAEGPKARYLVNEPLMIRILAESGGGTPMERVPVELYVTGNSGAAGGAYVVDLDPSANDGTWGYTSEADGTFLFDQAGLGKAGGYTLCARVRTPPGFAGFTFSEICTGLFHVN